MELTVRATKDGFTSTSTNVLALADREINVPTLRIAPLGEEEPESGKASNILLLDQSDTSIGVLGSGSREVANLTFQVADSSGRPVVLDKGATINFRFGVRPNGGEFISPTTAQTDNNGEVKVNLSSGTRAGVVQLIAETVVDGRTIVSRPVSVSIHGGLPDQTHFTLAPARFNFPGLTKYGLTNAISVTVGDKYANPVKPGTAVYFTTEGGIIEGSTLTNATGQGSVSLISANPVPNRGIAVVTASTADENQNVVTDRIPVVFSGTPVVTVSPSVASLDQTYSLTVEDFNGNPLAPGTTLSVRAEGTKVKAVGNTSVTLEDTAFRDQNGDGDILDYEDVLRGPGLTNFTFRVVAEEVEAPAEGETSTEDEPEVEAVTIKVSGPNGGYELVLTPGAGKVSSRTEGAIVEMLPNGAAQVRLAP